MIIVLVALYRQLNKLPLAAEGRIFATAFLEGLPIPWIDVLIKDCVDVGELLPLEEDIGPLITSLDAIVANLRILGAEDVILLAEGLGAQQMVSTGGREDAVRHVLAPHHHRGVLQQPLTLLGIHQYNYSIRRQENHPHRTRNNSPSHILSHRPWTRVLCSEDSAMAGTLYFVYIIWMNTQFLVEVPRRGQKQVNTNYISTTKYNIITFLPFALLLQFRRYANIYFLACAILQSIPLISPLKPFSAIAPLIFVLSLSVLREGFEDYKRYRSDQSDNSQICEKLMDGLFRESEWKDIKMGDILRLKKDEVIPADLLVLCSSNKSGISYVETASLDGEKNLKPKFSLSGIQKQYNTKNCILEHKIEGSVRCINPSAEIEAFHGQTTLRCEGLAINEKINKKNMVLRGCKVKNTDWLTGLVVYIGKETAIMMNSSTPYNKISNIERTVNNYIIGLMVFEVLCSFASAGYCYYGCVQFYSFENYLFRSNPSCLQVAGISFGSYFILYSTFIPISLIVSLEFVKVFQGYFMSTDQQMYCAANKRGLECHTVSINEELGQIEYILTDKTGTLTCNKMEFRNVVIGHELYGENINLNPLEDKINYERLSSRYSETAREEYNFDSRTLRYDLINNNDSNPSREVKRTLIELMFTMIATCHECVANSKGDYEGPSPDEVALLQAAKMVGFRFISCENKTIQVEYRSKIKHYELLRLIEFDSDRKRMTVVLRSSGNILVFVKGADTSISKILSPNQQYFASIQEKTDQMSKTGLRCLWFAYKILPLNTNIDSLLETDLQSQLSLVGATGIEDKLQDYVAETIFSLRSGGIKFVMLTGDKLETAENIALSCRLIEKGQLIRNGQELRRYASSLELNGMTMLERSPIIDGSTFSFLQYEEELKIAIGYSVSVVFSRVTPGQKAEIVRLVKSMGKLTLAIGDGANDVNMIMEAHVGIGIFGEEGTRAAQVANYAIGQFCLLWKLLLYHGRINYMRISEMILYFFYKNMVFTSVQLAYCFYNLGSGWSFWLSWSITFYNMVFTFFPVVIRAVFEVDIILKPTKETFHELSKGVHEKQILYSYYPRMYFISQQNTLFTSCKFITWFILGIAQGMVCLFITLYAIGDENDTSGASSYGIGFYFVEISAYTSVIIVVTIKLAVNVKHWTLILVIGFLVPSIGAYVSYTFIAQIFESTPAYHSMIDLLSMPIFYIIQLLSVGGMFCVDFFLFSIEATKNNFENYLRIKTLKDQRLSETNLKEYMIEMVPHEKR